MRESVSDKLLSTEASAIHKCQSIAVAFELACSDEEAAMILRRHIDNGKQLSGDMPWPPSSSCLLSDERQPPFLLEEFLSFVISGKPQKIYQESLRGKCTQSHRIFAVWQLMLYG